MKDLKRIDLNLNLNMLMCNATFIGLIIVPMCVCVWGRNQLTPRVFAPIKLFIKNY